MIKFLGDAIFVMWPCEKNASHTIKSYNTYMAVCCAQVRALVCVVRFLWCAFCGVVWCGAGSFHVCVCTISMCIVLQEVMARCGHYTSAVKLDSGESFVVDLQLHCGIGAGITHGFLVGAYHRWEYVPSSVRTCICMVHCGAW